ncbi:MAG: hypothetical protein J7M19_04575, partial [Planctomycetes bacterium]|nr:hypothetical protein [Planctomycetota bacterium]
AEASELAARLGLPVVVARLLLNRGYHSIEEASRFLRPSLDHLEDPESLKGVREAVERISTAIGRNEKILLYGDYDVDGMTSVALLHHFSHCCRRGFPVSCRGVLTRGTGSMPTS